MGTKADLVVVGASFAGLACARAAALAGLHVVVLEKKTSAGAKLHSTGILVKDAVDSVPWLQQVPAQLTRKVEGVRLYAPNLRHVDLYANGYYFLTTDTPALLDWMASSLLPLGVEVRFGQVFETASELPGQSGWLVQHGPGQTLQARYLVGADGPHSRVAKALGLSQNRHFLYGLEHEYTGAQLEPKLLHCFIDAQLAKGYIGWATAGVHTAQVGLARRLTPQQSGVAQHGLRHADMQAFLHKIQAQVQVPDAPPQAVRAGMIPCGGVLPQVARARALLVGDAAGMVSPVTAGGIHTALHHGGAVGAAVADYVRGQQSDPAQWLPASYPAFRRKRLLRWLFDHAQTDWAFNLLLQTRAMRRAAELVYFHKRSRVG